MKLKDNIKLQDLEKYGFRKVDIYNGDKIKYYNTYCISQNFEDYEGIIYDFEVELYVNKKRQLDTCCYQEYLDLDFIFDLICRLVKDEIIEEGDK